MTDEILVCVQVGEAGQAPYLRVTRQETSGLLADVESKIIDHQRRLKTATDACLQEAIAQLEAIRQNQ